MSARHIALFNRLPPASLDLNFLAGTLDSRITFTRAAGTQSNFDGTGTMVFPGTNVARFDYTPVSLVPRGLLIEELRSNVIIHSQAINSWPTKTDTTVADSNAVSPDGTTNASRLTEGVGGTSIVTSTAGTVAGGATVAYTLFLKRGNTDWVRCIYADTANVNGMNVWVNLASGALGTTTARGTATGISTSISAVGNGWYRVAGTCTLPVGSTTAAITTCSAAGDTLVGRVNNAVYYSWGAQAEVGNFPTSYMPTTTATDSRQTDLTSMPAPPPGQVPFSVAVEATYPYAIGVAQQGLAMFDDGTTNNRISVRGVTSPANTISIIYVTGASVTASVNAGTITPGTTFKVAAACTASGVVSAFNGAGITQATGAAPSGLTLLHIGENVPDGIVTNGYLRRIRYWPRALTAQQLQQVTQ